MANQETSRTARRAREIAEKMVDESHGALKLAQLMDAPYTVNEDKGAS
jgi:hypothetical protein